MNRAYELAKKETGVVEWGDGSNPRVVAYYKDAGSPEVKDDSVAWCAAFVGAMLSRAGVQGTRSLLARSYLDWGLTVATEDAKEGDIVVFRRGKSVWQGHVGFFVRREGDRVYVLGGNQRDSVNITPYAASDLLGVRRVVNASLPVSPASPASPVPSELPAPSAGWLQGLVAALASLLKRRA